MGKHMSVEGDRHEYGGNVGEACYPFKTIIEKQTKKTVIALLIEKNVICNISMYCLLFLCFLLNAGKNRNTCLFLKKFLTGFDIIRFTPHPKPVYRLVEGIYHQLLNKNKSLSLWKLLEDGGQCPGGRVSPCEQPRPALPDRSRSPGGDKGVAPFDWSGPVRPLRACPSLGQKPLRCWGECHRLGSCCLLPLGPKTSLVAHTCSMTL